MKAVKCEECNAEVTTDSCVFATFKSTVDGEEYTFCCSHCAKEFKRNKNTQE